MTTRSAEEAKQEYIRSMGEALGSKYYALWQDVAGLYTKWHQFLELFGTKPTRVDLLNQAAPLFFRIVQNTLWDDILLNIARLTDPSKSVGKANLTIQLLYPLIPDTGVQTKLKAQTELAIRAANFSRDWRNRRIAHRDLDLALDSQVFRLEHASREKVAQSLHAIVEVLNTVSQHYSHSTNYFDLRGHPGDAVSLLYVLDAGLRANRQERERISRGDHRPDDFAPQNL